MQMRHRFASIRAVVEHQPVAALLEPEFLRHIGGLEQQVPQHLMIRRRSFSNARDGLFRNQQNVGRGLRSDVMESENKIIFIDNLRRDLSRNDLFEKSFAHS